VNRIHLKRLGSAFAAVALVALSVGSVSAAVPNASATGFSYGDFGGNGYAGFSETFTLTDSSTLSKLYLESDIVGGASVPVLSATLNGSSVANACSVQASPLSVKCLFKTVRTNDVINVTFGVDPLASASSVTTEGFWSSSGYVTGGNNSHGDAWPSGLLTANRGGNGNFAGGFGNASLATDIVNLGGNSQAATLKGLPGGKYASVNDDAAPDATSGFPVIELHVNDGAPATFQLVIVYPKGTNAPKGYEHTSDGYPTVTYTSCARGDTSDCFVWSNKNTTTILYLSHNGFVRTKG